MVHARTLAVAVLACAQVAGCRGANRATDPNAIVVLHPNLVRDLDPRYALSAHDTKLSRLVAPGLTTVDQPSMEPKLELAAAIEPIDDVTWRVRLRDDVAFGNGEPVTAADVLYTFESAMDPAYKSLYRRAWTERFARIEAIDERTVVFHLQQPLGTLLSDLDFGIVWRGHGRGEGSVVGAGKYRVRSFHPERVVLEANPHRADAPATPVIDVRVVRDSTARVLMLVGGTADLAQNAVRPDLISELTERDNVAVQTGPSAVLTSRS